MIHNPEKTKQLFFDVLSESLKSGKQVDITPLGYSMFPSFKPNDIVTLQSADCKTIKRGDVILTNNNGRYLLHRLIKINKCKQLLLTRGDSCLKKDDLISGDSLIGKFVAHKRMGKSLELRHKTIVKFMIVHTSFALPFFIQLYMRLRKCFKALFI